MFLDSQLPVDSKEVVSNEQLVPELGPGSFLVVSDAFLDDQ